MEVVRGCGTLGVAVGLGLILTSFVGPFKFSPQAEPKMAKWWAIAGRIGWGLSGVSLLLVLISLM